MKFVGLILVSFFLFSFMHVAYSNILLSDIGNVMSTVKNIGAGILAYSKLLGAFLPKSKPKPPMPPPPTSPSQVQPIQPTQSLQPTRSKIPAYTVHQPVYKGLSDGQYASSKRSNS